MTLGTFSTFALRLALFVPAVLMGGSSLAFAQAGIKVMTYNTHHGGTATRPATTDYQLDTIAAENPDVVILQEAYSSQLASYVNGLNARQHTTAWHGSYNKTCKVGVEPVCTTFTSESVMILTKLRTLAVTPRLIWAKDSYHAARATLRMSVATADGTEVNVFAAHLPALVAYSAARVTWVNTFKTWASSFAGPKIVGGDFNERPTEPAVSSMLELFNDAWRVGGSGYGYTHVKDGTTTPYRRIDYLFFDKASGLVQSSVKVAGKVTDSDHLAVVGTYTVLSTAVAAPTAPAAPVTSTAPVTATPTAPVTATPTAPAPAETTLFADRFDSFDATQWPAGVITGTRDTSVPVGLAGGLLQIGDLKDGATGAHYNGLSTAAFNLSNSGCAAVQLVQGVNPSTRAYAMFAVVRDASNLYRWYQSGDSLVAEQKVNGVKTVLVDLQYAPATHQFLRIRKVTNAATGTEDVVFETAPSLEGAAGTYTERYRNTWGGAVNATGLRIEIKAGTSGAAMDPGSAYWDNVSAASNCR